MGIDYTVNEAKYLLSTLEAIINDKRPVPSLNRVNWNTIFRLANFHKIANVLYYAILGSNERMTKDIRRSFYTAFNDALLSYDRIASVQEALFWKFDIEKIDVIVFRGSNFNDLYPMREMGVSDALELYIVNSNKEIVDGIMSGLDFTASSLKQADCIVYTRNPKCEIKVYLQNPFYDGTMKKYYDNTFSRLSNIGSYKHIYGFDTDTYYIFMVSMIANSYALKISRIRQLLDLWVFYQKYYDDFNWEYIQGEFKKLYLSAMADRILELCFIWFDDNTASNPEDIDIYDNMENFILSRGDIGFEESCQYFPLVYRLNKLLIKEKEKLEKEDYKKFLYPDKEYMQSLYPTLTSYGKSGLMLAYMVRRLRLLFGKKSNVNEDLLESKTGIEFYEPQSNYPEEFLATDDTENDGVKAAPLVVSNDVEVMDGVLPANIDGSTGNVRSAEVGYMSESEIIKQNEAAQKNAELEEKGFSLKEKKKPKTRLKKRLSDIPEIEVENKPESRKRTTKKKTNANNSEK